MFCYHRADGKEVLDAAVHYKALERRQPTGSRSFCSSCLLIWWLFLSSVAFCNTRGRVMNIRSAVMSVLKLKVGEKLLDKGEGGSNINIKKCVWQLAAQLVSEYKISALCFFKVLSMQTGFRKGSNAPYCHVYWSYPNPANYRISICAKYLLSYVEIKRIVEYHWHWRIQMGYLQYLTKWIYLSRYNVPFCLSTSIYCFASSIVQFW